MSNISIDERETRVAVRLPSQLAVQLRALAERDANNMSATIRRLLAHAVAREQQAAAG